MGRQAVAAPGRAPTLQDPQAEPSLGRLGRPWPAFLPFWSCRAEAGTGGRFGSSSGLGPLQRRRDGLPAADFASRERGQPHTITPRSA